jgi:transketolase
MPLSPEKVAELRCKATEVRKNILKSVATAGAGHVGGPMSATDMLVTLYFSVMNVDPKRPDWEDRDRFILSKGHSAIGLYSTLAVRGYLPVEELATFDAIDSRLQGHPDMTKLPGLDMSTGSLGQGLSPAIGMGLGARMLGKSFHVWCMLGDGEIQEGQIWEAAFVAARYSVDNVTAILDYNTLQQYGFPPRENPPRKMRTPMEDPGAKFRAFGWNTIEINGHDYVQIQDACEIALATKGRPTVIVANTVKGKGVSFMENDPGWHAKAPNPAELKAAIAELDAVEARG